MTKANATDSPRASRGIPAIEWRIFHVSFRGFTSLCGSVPADPEIVKAWLDARKPRVRAPDSKSLEEINEEVLASLGDPLDEASCNILGFQHHLGWCSMRAGTIKAHLKDCARRLSARVGKIQGESAFSTKVINYVYPDPAQYWIPVRRPDGEPVTKHDGERDKPISTRYGTALKRFEYIDPWRLDFRLQVLTTSGIPAVSREDLEKLLLYGGVHGYAGERGDGEGKYSATITEG